MKSKILLISFLLFISLEKSFGQVTFQKTYNQTQFDYGYSIQQTNDGGYIIAGSNGLAFPYGQKDVYLIKTNGNGEILWTKTFGGSGDDEAFSVQQTFDGGYIVAGYTESFGLTNSKIYILKTNASGYLVWSKIVYGVNYGRCSSIQQTLDSCYILTGGSDHASLFKIDANGSLIWSKVYLNNQNIYSNSSSVQQTSDSGYIFAGAITFGTNNPMIYLVKTDSNGNSSWSKTYGNNIYGGYKIVKQTTDGGYIIGATIINSGNYNFYLIKTNNNGDTLWSKIYDGGGTDFLFSLQQTNDGGYILAGSISDPSLYNVYIIKINSNGSTLWTKSYGGFDVDDANSIHQTSDRGFVMVGKTISFGNDWDIYLIKTDSNGNNGGCNEINISTVVSSYPTVVLNIVTTDSSGGYVSFSPTTVIGGTTTVDSLCFFPIGIKEPTINKTLLSIYPNPTNTKINITLSTPEIFSITLYNSIGQIIKQLTIDKGQLKTEIDLSQFPKGLYYLTVKGHEWVRNEKVVKN